MKKKLSIPLLIALVGFPQISETIYTPALPNLTQELMTTASMSEMSLTLYFLGFAVGVLLWGIVSDKIGRRTTMLLGLLVYGTSSFNCSQVETINALLFWRFLQALGASVGSVITQTILRDAYDGTKRAQLFAIMSGTLAFSPAIGPIIGGMITQIWGWKTNFTTLTIMAIILFAWSFFSLKETRPINTQLPSLKNTYHLFIQMIQDRCLWGHSLLIGATNGILFGFYQEAPFVFIEQQGISPSVYGCFGIVIALGSIASARLNYVYHNRWEAEKRVSYGSWSVVIGGIAFLLITLFSCLNASSCLILFLITALFIVFFGIGLIIPNVLSQALKNYQNTIGSAGSLFGASYYCLIAGFTWLMSYLHNDTAIPLPFYITLLGFILIKASSLTKSSSKS